MKKLFFLLSIPLAIALLAGRDKATELWKIFDAKGDKAFQHYQIEESCQYWQAAIKENPDNLKAYNKLAISFLLLKEHDKAVDILKEGLKLNSDSLSLNYNLALAYYYSDDVRSALEVSEKVLMLNSSYPEANYLRGLCLEKMGRIKESQRAYVEELNNNPGSRRAWQKVRTEL